MKKGLLLVLFLAVLSVHGQTIKILFNGKNAESAGNADWVIDADIFNVGYSGGPPVAGSGSEANPQQIPTPAQSAITSSTSETYWKGGISAWGIDLVKKGYVVESLPITGSITYGNSSNPQDLSNYKVFIDCEPNILYTSAEKTAILQFVQNGGGLFMVADHTNSDRNNDGYDSPEIWNDLMTNNGTISNPFGISFDLVDISQTTTNVPTFPTDPILHGIMGDVTSVKWSNGTTMTISPTANSSVKGIIYKTGSSFGNSNVMFAYATYGNGKVCGIGDSSPCDDGTGDTGDQLYYGYTGEVSGNHQRLLVNASIWLATSSTPVTSAITNPATSISLSSATLNGTINPNGLSTSYHFDWGTTTSYGSSTATLSAGSGSSAVNVNTNISGLAASTTYHFRISATNSSGTYNGSDITFTTPCASFSIPFSESFTNTTIPNCWTVVDNQGNGQVWIFGSMTTGSPVPVLTGNYAYLNSDGYGSGNSQNSDLLTPTLDFTGYIAANLAFKHYFKSYTGSSGTLSYSINNGATWTTLATYTTTSSTNPTQFSQAVNAVAGQSQVKFKWNYTGSYGYYWAIDDIQITGTLCTPQSVGVTISASANPVCPGISVTLTATPINGGTSPVYQWKVNNSAVGTNLNTYIYTPVNLDVVTCTLTSNATCITGNPAISPGITMNVRSLPGPSATPAGLTTVCTNSTGIIYSTDSAANATSYQWQFPTGLTINGSSALKTISLNYPSAPVTGVISVRGINTCGSGSYSPALNVVSNAPLTGQVTFTSTVVPSGVQECLTGQTFSASGNDTTLLVMAGASETLIASNYIRFFPGTSIQYGAYFHGYITDQCAGCPVMTVPPGIAGKFPVPGTIQVEPVKERGFRLYPNPANEELRIQTTGFGGNAEWLTEVYTLMGHRIFSSRIKDKNEFSFSLDNWQPGVYFVRVSCGDYSEIRKFTRIRE